MKLDFRVSLGLTAYEFNLLLKLDPVREQTPGELAGASQVPRKQVHRALGNLVEKGFARATTLPTSRFSLHPRKTYVRLRMPQRELLQQLVNQIDSQMGFLGSWKNTLEAELFQIDREAERSARAKDRIP